MPLTGVISYFLYLYLLFYYWFWQWTSAKYTTTHLWISS